MDDLASLSELDENSLLGELKKRYNQDIFYTYIGDILIALNPYKTLDIYGSEKGKQYTEVGVRSQLPPHIYAISDAAYQNMLRNGTSQCCVVSGESGAGKTESTKLMIEHIAQLCRHNAKDDLNDRIVNVNPLLEAFGNAQTVINNNSSRFGKYIELLFDKRGHLIGANISEYLLEKSRVVCQSPGERNFHIFYYLFAGLDYERMQANLLKTPEDHRIIRPAGGGQVFANQTEVDHCREMWTVVLNIMNNVGFTEEQVDGVLAILAAVLHISDIEFETDPETEGVIIKNENIVALASQLLAVDYEQLIEALISTVSNVGSGSETVTSLKSEAQANDGRDALAKALYGRLFSWMVYQVNAQLSIKNRQPDMSIGILDIYGFENFKKNSFEQLCINVTNEQLQCFFNEHIFRWELDEYKREGISGNNITYVDNKPLLDLFLESLGLFCLLDDESKFPQGTDQSFADKLTNSFSKKSEFRAPKGHCLEFSIQHFAGLVTYNVDGFLEKNRDSLSENLTTCMKKSHAKLVHELFSPVSEFGQLMISSSRTMKIRRFDRQSRMFLKLPDLKATSATRTSKRLSQMIRQNKVTGPPPKPKPGAMPKIGESSPVGGSKTTGTLGSQFKNSLFSLMTRLSEAQPHFIRCVKPNAEKAANRFKPDMVLQQLRYTGVLETVKIRKQGYPTRLTFVEFMHRYRFVASTAVVVAKPDAKSCSHLLDVAGLKNWRIGHSKVFLRYYHVEQLNALLTEFLRKVSVCQKYVRSFMARQKYKQLQEVASQYNEKTIELQNIIEQINDEWVTQQRRLVDEDVQNYKQKLERVERKKLKNKTPEIDNKPDESIEMSDAGRGTIKPAGVIYADVLQFKDQVTMCASPCECTWRTFKETLLRTSFSESVSRRQDTLQTLLADTLPKLKDTNADFWAKVYLMEKNSIVGKFYIKDDDMEINDSNCSYTGAVCGLNNPSFQHALGDSEVASAMREVGKGVRISRDKAGNAYLTRLSPCPVRVRGVGDSDVCLASEISSSKGALGNGETKVFDISLFKKRIASALKNHRTCNPHDFNRLSAFSFTVGQHPKLDIESPLWFVIIHIEALSLLGKPDVLKELLSMARIPEDETLKKNWRHLNFISTSRDIYEEIF